MEGLNSNIVANNNNAITPNTLARIFSFFELRNIARWSLPDHDINDIAIQAIFGEMEGGSPAKEELAKYIFNNLPLFSADARRSLELQILSKTEEGRHTMNILTLLTDNKQSALSQGLILGCDDDRYKITYTLLRDKLVFDLIDSDYKKDGGRTL